jgi:hypothetical protein
MKKIKVIALAMAVLMLQPVLLACSAKTEKKTTVKEDDPWYESVRFDLDPEMLPTEMFDSGAVSYSNGKLYHMYSLTNQADMDNYRRALLDTYDEGGNVISRTTLQSPVGYVIDRVISFTPDAEGKKAEAVMSLFTPGNFETGIVNVDMASGEVSNIRMFKDKNGDVLQVTEIVDGVKTTAGVSDVCIAGGYYIPVLELGFGTENSTHAFVYKGSKYLSELDFTGIPYVYNLEEFSFDPRSNTIFTVGYTLKDGAMVLEFDPETGKRITFKKYEAQGDGEVNLADYKPVSSGELFKIDSLGNITTFDMQAQEVKTVIDNNWYTPYFSDLARMEVKLITCDGNTAVICSRKETDYSLFYGGKEETITILMKSQKNPHAGKTVIELATPIDTDISEYLSNAIYKFNKTDTEYLIRVWGKYKTGIKAGRDLSMLNMDDEKLYTMIQELKGSEAPDLAVGIQKTYAMRDDVFEDLTGYLDQEVMDKQFKNIIEAARIGNKQYFLPVTLEIEGLVTDTALLKDGACGITFDDYEKMIVNDLDGFSPYDYPLSTYNYKKDFILSCIDTKAALEGSSVNFGTDQFYAAIEFSNDHFAQDGFTKPADYVWEEEEKRVRTACRYDRISTYLEFIRACKDDSNSYTIIGTPSVDASGPRFRALETISVTSSSDTKEGSRKFINYLFAGAAFTDPSDDFPELVTNKEIMARNIPIITEKNNQGYHNDELLTGYMTVLGDYASTTGYKKASKDMEDNMMASLSSISKYYYEDPVITSFLVEEIAPYYAGDRSLDDVVRYLNDRAEKYTKEM